ncbi:MAG: GIY-YIG nuclease family protein [Bacterioplanes sp.]|nr:GIY-YIG nuclease family protein [Bacterioplanes sp.]
MENESVEPVWFMYVIRTYEGHLYCGISTDVTRRFAEHCANGAKTARRLRGRGPLQLVFSLAIGSQSAALVAEARFKRLSKPAKERWLLSALSE